MEVKESQVDGFHEDSAEFSNRLSYFHSIGKNSLLYRTIGQQLSIAANEDPDREAFVFFEENIRFTYGELLEKADCLAAGFQCLGLEKGDRVAILAPNVSMWPIVFYSAARAGLILVSLNPTFNSQKIAEWLNKVKAKVLVASEQFGSEYNYYEKLLETMPELRTSHGGKIQSKAIPSLSTIIIDSEKNYTGTLRLKDVMTLPRISQIQNIEEQQKDISPDSGYNIQFTSGFTGPPKAVLVSHFGDINNAISFGERCEVNSARMCMPVPFFHIYAITISLAALCNQGTVVVPSFIFNPEKTLQAIWKERCSIIFSMPKFYIELIAKQRELKLDINLKIGVSGGSMCSPELFYETKKELGLEKFKMALGMTESRVSFAFVPDEVEKEKLDTVGYVLDNTEVKVTDGEGKMVPFGTPGELCVRGYQTMIGYWEDEEKTRKVLGSDGWIRTGDFVVLESNGYGKIIGRISDLITKGSERIFPKDIEILLGKHPSIAEVYIVGVPDEHLGEELCAFIGLRDEFEAISSQDIYKYCQGKIAQSHIPRHVQLVKDFPKTVSGKVIKSDLREQFLRNRENLDF
uniref:Medium-chain acyl-CoA ligase ACSF2, mitochondrial n=1 Tax=Lutzomyia longipalpis TaxID=7200 RepID=A0A1B0CPA1_LUTLO